MVPIRGSVLIEVGPRGEVALVRDRSAYPSNRLNSGYPRPWSAGLSLDRGGEGSTHLNLFGQLESKEETFYLEVVRHDRPPEVLLP